MAFTFAIIGLALTAAIDSPCDDFCKDLKRNLIVKR